MGFHHVNVSFSIQITDLNKCVESEDLKCLVVGCSKVQAGGGLLC